MQNFRPAFLAASTLAVGGLALSGCVTLINPEQLAAPAHQSCFDLTTPVSYQEERGVFHILWETRLERGPYVADREDATGTFYRAPPGGVSISRPLTPDKRVGEGTLLTWDGGIWIPRDPGELPLRYLYVTMDLVPPVVPPLESNCSNVAVLRDPTTQGVSAIEYGVAGAIGGAAGGFIARSAGKTGVSYVKAVGTGAVGGAIGGAVVGVLINTEIGKIQLLPPDTNAAFISTIRAAAAEAAPFAQAPASSASSAS